MATLRDRILNNPSAVPIENVEGMGDFRRGLRNALIGTEANVALAEESAARAAGDVATADARAQRVNLLRAQQGMAPLRVGRVEDINGVGDAVDWAAGQLGSAAGSMAAPVAAGAGTAAAGALLSMAPNAGVRTVGRGLRTVGTPAVPFVMNAEQMKGEFYGNAKEDATLMANTSAQTLDNMGNAAGVVGGALDTILPTTVARGLTGAGLRQGLRSGGASRVMGGALMEGGTELAQGEVGRQLRGVLNPEQDTSGFASERLNEFAAGAVGGAPFAAAGELADSGWRRVGDTANRVGETAGRVAGQVVDLGQDAMQQVTERGTEMFDAVRGKVVDLKGSLKERTSQARSTWEASQEEVDLLEGQPPADVDINNPDAFRAWWDETNPRRTQFIADQLKAMQDDPSAQELLAQLAETDPQGEGWDDVIQEGADFLLERRRLDSLAKTAARSVGEAAGELGSKAKGVAATAGSALWGFMNRRKQNRQGGAAPTDLIGEYLAAETKPELTRYAVAQGDKSIPRYMRQLGNELSAMIEAGVEVDGKALLHLNRMANHMVGAYGPRAAQVVAELSNMAGPQSGPLVNALAEQVSVAQARGGQRQTLTLRRQAADALLTALPIEAEQRLLKEGVNLRSDEGKRQLLGMVEAVATGRASREARTALEKLVGAEAVVDMVQAIEPSPSAEAEAALFAPEGPQDEALTENGLEVTDDGDVIDAAQPSDFEKRGAEKNVVKGSGAMYFGFARRPTLDDNQNKRDPFGYTTRYTRDEALAAEAAGENVRRRPMLFKQGEKLHSGEDAIADRIKSMKRYLKVPEKEDGSDGPVNYRVDAKRVSEVMDSLNMQPLKRLQLFRDYMAMEAKSAEGEAAQKLRAISKAAGSALLDRLRGPGERGMYRLGPKEHKKVDALMKRFFDERFMVVGEQLSDRDPERVTPADLKAMAESGEKVAELARKAEAEDGEYAARQLRRDANLLTFMREGKPLQIKADDLVKWARKVREGSTKSDFEDTSENYSADAKNDAYLADLSTGIGALVNEGLVDGLPSFMGESFAKGVPDALGLPSGTVGSNKERKAKRAKERGEERKEFDEQFAGPNTPDRMDVAAEQNRDWFVVDDAMPEESMFVAERSEGEALARARRRKDQGDKSLIRELKNEELRERMTSGETRKGELDDVYSAQRRETMTSGEDARNLPPEAKAMTRAEARRFGAERGLMIANSIRKGDVAPVLPRIKQWMRMAQGKYNLHNLTPVLEALSAESIAKGDLSPEDAGLMHDARMEALRLIRDSEESAVSKVRYARALAKPEAARRINDTNVNALLTQALEKGAQTGTLRPFDLSGPPVVPPSRQELDAASTEALARAEEVAPRLGKPGGGARKRNAQSVQIHNDLQRGGFAATHDSPHRFDGRFNWRSHKMKGEGAMVFGAGTYLSTGDKVHSFYKKQFSKAVERTVTWDGEVYTLEKDEDSGETVIVSNGNLDPGKEVVLNLMMTEGLSPAEAADEALRRAYSVVDHSYNSIADYLDVSFEGNPKAVTLAKKMSSREPLTAEDVAGFSSLVDYERWNRMLASAAKKAEALKDIDVSDVRVTGGVSPTYQVSVQIMPSQLLLWDKPREKQSKLVQRVIDKAISELGLKGSEQTRAGIDGKLITYRDELSTGEQVYKAMAAKLGSMEKASDWLQANGVLGHEYPASNGRDSTTPNYVIYDDSKIVTNYVHFNAQTTAGGPQSTPEAQAEARDYIKRVLGPKVKVEFQKLTGYSGEWVDAENTIYISTTPAPGTMQVAYHEALHAFFSKWVANDQRAMDVLQELADNEAIMRRVRALIGNDPAALDQLQDGEERLAYIFQFWAAGALELPYGKPTTLLRKVTKFLRRVAGMVTDLERSVAIFEALHRGDFGKGQVAGTQALQNALQMGMTSRKTVRKLDGLVQKAAALTLPAETILKDSASQSAKRIGELFFVNPGDDTTGKEEGYLNARDQMARRYVNEFSRAMDGLQESDYKAVGDYMAKGTELADIPLDIHRETVKNIRALLKRFRQYMVDERGVKMGDQGEKYFPRVWSLDKLMTKTDQFLAMIATKYPDKDGPAILASLTENTASDIEVGRPRDEDGVLTPLNRAGEERVFSWMAPEDAAPFLETNLVGVLTRYFHEGVRAAEYTARFGQNGEKLEKLLVQADKELFDHSRKLMRQGVLADEKAADAWHKRQYRDVRESVGAMEGTLGKDISAGWRATNSWVTVYQNIRLLPLSLFASVVDPMGMIARGAEMGEAYEAFKRGITEVGRQWRDIFKEQPTKRQGDEWERLAQYVGSVDAAMFESQVSDMYASVYMNPTAKKWNDTFFKLNGMEAWNRGMRIGATKAAVQFIQRHASLPVKDSKRWLEELGLKPGDIELGADGKLLVSVGEIAQAKGISREAAREIAGRLHTGINRWVTGAVLTPNAAQRPAWSSDPHYSMFFHLKQFTYSFHQTILKRAVREGAQGNIAPMMSLFWYVPIMVGADLIKGVIQGGGELPTHMKGMDAGEWLMYGVERSGIMGLGTLGVDAQDNLASVGGPMVEQVISAFSDPLERTAVKALPANAVYREALL